MLWTHGVSGNWSGIGAYQVLDVLARAYCREVRVTTRRRNQAGYTPHYRGRVS